MIVHVGLLWLWLCLPPFNSWYQQLVLRVYSEMVLPNDRDETINFVRHVPIRIFYLVQRFVNAFSTLFTH